ncbi:AMP-binding protein [Cumulibacter soli]|uniref:AMP-binding protein n=1 Tax=Cumulibacter soli TaxID=2546344 RepID=UPI001067E7B4|nr:AMP-binding protein [Cumulibacter soli]
MTGTDQQLQEWMATYGAPDADIAHLLCDRHPAADRAFTVVDEDLSSYGVTYGELADASRRLATVLARRGVTEGSRVPVLLGKRPELVVALLALWRLGAVHVPLFTAFATGAIAMRVEGSGARQLITDATQREKVDPLDVEVLDVDELVVSAKDAEPIAKGVAIGGDGIFLQLYTSGTTGKPKGVPIPTRALATFHSYLHYALDVAEDDVFWNAADPGWAYGLFYSLIGPMLTKRTSLMFTGGFEPVQTMQIMREFGVTNFCGAPTMYRAIRASSADAAYPLRRASSAGEPLTPDVVSWAKANFGIEVRDHYGQTELGMVICNLWHPAVARPLKEGSMGIPLPGISADIVDGQIAIDVAASPALWFSGYVDDPAKSAERFSADGAWYLTADTGRVDDDGYFFFNARDDDVILAAGYRIGPFDVESVLVTHPAVAEVAVVGRPDPDGVRGEMVEAFVVLMPGSEPGPELAEELQRLVRDQYSKHAYPRKVNFVTELPKTPSGKVQRFLLRQASAE